MIIYMQNVSRLFKKKNKHFLLSTDIFADSSKVEKDGGSFKVL